MNFEIHRSTEHEIESMLCLIRSVHEQLPQKEWFVIDDDANTAELLKTGKSRGYVAAEAETGELAGLFIVNFPGTAEHNLGYDVFSPDSGFSEEVLSQIVHMDTAVVAPAYRGHGLQRKMIEFAENDLKTTGYHILMCTVHPRNRFSLDNALALGYRIMVTKEKYGGYLRHVLMKEI